MKKMVKGYETMLAYNTIKNIIEHDTDNKINPALKFKLLMLYHNTLSPIFNEYDNTRVSLIKNYGVETKDEDGNVIGMEIPENSNIQNKFKKDMKEIQDNDIEINFTPITYSELFGMGLPVEECETLIIITEDKEYKGE